MKNYKIIYDKDKLLEFIDWLPELEDNEKFYLSLFARKKYCPNLIKANDKTQLRRFTSNKSRMYDKIKQLEIELGAWKLKDVSAPQESLVVYIMPNPRCMKKATEMMGKKCWDLFRSQNYNLHTEAMSCIQKSKSRGIYVDFDIDTEKKSLDFVNEMKIVLSDIFPDDYSKVCTIVETRGGYHILVNAKKATKIRVEYNLNKNWYNDMINNFKIDQSADQMIPVPGTIQGGFVPKIIKDKVIKIKNNDNNEK